MLIYTYHIPTFFEDNWLDIIEWRYCTCSNLSSFTAICPTQGLAVVVRQLSFMSQLMWKNRLCIYNFSLGN